MEETISREIAAIGADTRSGASALLFRAVDVLQRVASDPATLHAAAAELCRAQPAMAGIRSAAAIARTAADAAAALERFRQSIARAPAAIARQAADLLVLRRGGAPAVFVTCSASAAVEAALGAIAERLPVRVACAEGRPQLEGRSLAARLAERRIAVELYTDAAVGVALDGADALLVGADAVGPTTFINKVGTRALCALASSLGVPVYVLAGREKLLEDEEFGALRLNAGAAADVWDSPPPGVSVRNPYFEEVPLGAATGLVTDSGVRQIYER